MCDSKGGKNSTLEYSGIFRVPRSWRPSGAHGVLWPVLLPPHSHRQRAEGGHQGGDAHQSLHHPPERGHSSQPGGVLFQARLSAVRHVQWGVQQGRQPPVRIWLRRLRPGQSEALLVWDVSWMFRICCKVTATWRPVKSSTPRPGTREWTWAQPSTCSQSIRDLSTTKQWSTWWNYRIDIIKFLSPEFTSCLQS